MVIFLNKKKTLLNRNPVPIEMSLFFDNNLIRSRHYFNSLLLFIIEFYLIYSRKPHPTLVGWGWMRSHFTVLLISDGQISDCVVFWSPVSGYIFPGFQYQPLQSLPENNCHSRKSLSIISRGSALDTAFLLPWKAVSSDCIWPWRVLRREAAQTGYGHGPPPRWTLSDFPWNAPLSDISYEP